MRSNKAGASPAIALALECVLAPPPDGAQRVRVAATYGSAEIPETVFIDARGIVRAIRLGGMSPAQLSSALARIVPKAIRALTSTGGVAVMPD